MKAIETQYKGYRFRSRLEARWAVFFDALGIRWEYEPEGFELGFGERYLPDFKVQAPLSRFGEVWVEVKPSLPDAAAQRKARLLADHSRTPVVFCIGVPGDHETIGEDWNDDRACPARFCIVGQPMLEQLTEAFGRSDLCIDDAVRRAITAARGARFEFGESGAAQ
ncbi:hypothetical protein [Burkholderia gladioli]|uniref:hypothetical protein n=1 Tax=Burkholderia gladioli TaxID=28095 RepID=UPI0016410AC9|nr:hypothetical protein [Burkholderia gladioli]